MKKRTRYNAFTAGGQASFEPCEKTGKSKKRKVASVQQAQALAIMQQYMSAREFFAAAQDAAKELNAAEQTLERLRARERPRAQGFAAKITGSRQELLNPTDIRMIAEARMQKSIFENQRVVQACLMLLYGAQDVQNGLQMIAAMPCTGVENIGAQNANKRLVANGGSAQKREQGDAAGGVVELVGITAASTVFERVVMLKKWTAIARECACSVSWCRIKYAVVCDTIDARGWRACVRGRVSGGSLKKLDY